MVHAPVHAGPHAQAGFLRERPNPARIAAYAAVIALHAAALALLLMPMAAPEPARMPDRIVDAIFVPRKPRLVPVVPPPPQPTRPQPTRVSTRPVAATPPQPPVLVDAGETAPPVDASFVEDVTVVPPVDPGPLAMERLEYVAAPPPPYPPEAERRRLEGTVMLQVLVDVDGRPLEVLVQRSSGHRVLDEAARKFVLKRWTFRPAVRDGHPVPSIGLVPVKFSMR